MLPSLWSKTNGLFLGSFGDISVFSFGYSKIIDVGSGGAFTTNNFELFSRINNIIGNLKIKDKNYLNLKNIYRQRYLNILKNKNSHDNLLEIGSDLKDLFIYRCESLFANKLLNELDKFSKNKTSRISNYNKYKINLNSDNILLPDTYDGFIPWRFNFLSKKSKEITRSLRTNEIHVSNWYPPIHMYYKKAEIKTNLKNSIKLGKEIVNLWVDRKISNAYIYKTCDLINSII